MAEEPRKARSARTTLPMDAIKVVGTVPMSQVNSSRRLGERRWESIGAQIIAAADNDEALVVTLAKGYRAENVRAGISEELSRKGYKSKTTSTLNDDGSTTLHLTATKVTKPTASE